MQRYQWSRLNKQQVGAFTEYFVKMELTMYGFQVYSTEVDDPGVDFVARYKHGSFFQVQVKSLRGWGYVFLPKTTFFVKDDLYLALGLLTDGAPPELYLVPATAWVAPDGCFVSRDYGEGLQSEPEWGVNVSRRNLPKLERFRFQSVAEKLMAESEK